MIQGAIRMPAWEWLDLLLLHAGRPGLEVSPRNQLGTVALAAGQVSPFLPQPYMLSDSVAWLKGGGGEEECVRLLPMQ